MLFLPKKTIFTIVLVVILMTPVTVFAETVEYDGLIEPYVVVDIGAPAEGVVAEVTVDRSNSVNRGQVLVKMDSSVEQAAVEKAKVMATFDGEIGLQKTQLAFAKRAHKRFKKLEAIANHDKDQAATEIILVGQRLKKAREKRTMAQYELKKAQAILNRCSIKSPITGVVVDRYVSPGEYVNNQPLMRVAQIDPLRVEVIIPSRMFGQISPGMVATIVPELSHYGEHLATVKIVDKVIDAASSTFGVRLELPNKDQQIPSGMRCQVRFDIKEDNDKVTARIDPDQAQD